MDDVLAVGFMCAHIEDVSDYGPGAEGRDGLIRERLVEAVVEDGGLGLVGRWHDRFLVGQDTMIVSSRLVCRDIVMTGDDSW